MQMRSISIIVSFVLGLFVLEYIRSFDLHDKEPLNKMALVMVWGGFVSTSIGLIIYGWVHSLGIKELRNFYGGMFITCKAVSYPAVKAHSHSGHRFPSSDRHATDSGNLSESTERSGGFKSN
jgi:hypothetical protein